MILTLIILLVYRKTKKISEDNALISIIVLKNILIA